MSKSTRMLRRPAAIACLLAVTCIAGGRASEQPQNAQPDAGRVFARVAPAVVTIITPSGKGSGVFIDASGILLTNLHVIQGSSTARVVLSDGEAFTEVAVLDVDAQRDLAVLRVKGVSFDDVELGDSDALGVGATVFAIGSPSGLPQTLSQGIVSAWRQVDGSRMVQTTAAISPGSSGGGLFDGEGRLVALTAGKYDGESLNFAIPINYVRALLKADKPYPLSQMSQTAAIRNVAFWGGPVPSVASVYTGANGAAAIIEQRGALLRVTFAERNGRITGHAELNWNPNVEAFDGTGTTIAACDRGTRQTSDAAIKFSHLFVVSAGIIRTRWLHPNRVDCNRGVVLVSSWEEALWSAAR